MFDFDSELEKYVRNTEGSITETHTNLIVITIFSLLATTVAIMQIAIMGPLASGFESLVQLIIIALIIVVLCTLAIMINSILKTRNMAKKATKINKILTLRKFADASTESISTELEPGERIFEFAKRTLLSFNRNEENVSWNGTKTNRTNYIFDCLEESPELSFGQKMNRNKEGFTEDIVIGKHFGDNLTSEALTELFIQVMNNTDTSASKKKPIHLFCVAKNIDDAMTDTTNIGNQVDFKELSSEHKVSVREWEKNQYHLYIIKDDDDLFLPVNMAIG